MRIIRPVLLTAGLLVVSAVPALADPALPSNYESRIVDEAPDDRVTVRIEGGDAFFVLEVEAGTEVLVPGYDNDDDYSDWQELEVYLRVLPDGTVQLNRNSEAYYANADRYGAAAPSFVGAGVPPNWETVGSDGRVAWHDHRIHWMSPTPPASVDTDAGDRVLEYDVPLVVDGELVVARGELDYLPERNPAVVGLLALAGVVAGVLATRRDRLLGALLLLVAGGTVAGLLLASQVGRAPGFDIATPPLALVIVGAAAPMLGAAVSGVRDGQRRGLMLLGALAFLAFGILSTGVADGLVGGPGEGFGNWWTNPTLPADTGPMLLPFAIAVGTGLSVGLFAAIVSDHSGDLAELRMGGDPDTGTDG